MILPKVNPTTTDSWSLLQEHFKAIKDVKMMEWFEEDPERASKFSISIADLYFDYSKNRITTKTLKLLLDLAREVGLKEAIQQQLQGIPINETEQRAVLHTALRDLDSSSQENNKEIKEEINKELAKVKSFTNAIHSGEWRGFTNRKIDTIVNIGIGGSDLGPKMVVEALSGYKKEIESYFVSNIDGDHVHQILQKINPETTLFIVVSKSFTTQETLTNALTIRKWFLQFAEKKDIAKHFVAISTNTQAVSSFGIDRENTFKMWNWVGGRFSLWGSVGLSIALSLGYTHFESLLLGANEMDQHFSKTEFEENIPVIMALISIWYNNFFDSQTEAIIPYSQHLQELVPYLQQAIMESNGKQIDRLGKTINYQTGTIIWGATGTNAQHAFFQLLHQGTKFVPTDFIGFKHSVYKDENHDKKLMANFFAQTKALLIGKTDKEVVEELQDIDRKNDNIEFLYPFKVFEGNRPSNTLLFSKLSPRVLGKLLALYEHKLFVQGVIWNIFSYDQMGVELGKQLSSSLLKEIDTKKISEDHDPSTKRLLEEYMSV